MPLFNDKQEIYLNIARMKLKNDELLVGNAEQALIKSLGLSPGEVEEVRKQMDQELIVHRRRHFITGIASLLKSGVPIEVDHVSSLPEYRYTLKSILPTTDPEKPDGLHAIVEVEVDGEAKELHETLSYTTQFRVDGYSLK